MNIPSEVMERYRDINVDHDWWDCTYDYWKSRLERMGVEGTDINFSGFWSQGDGASFTGYVSSARIKRFMRIHGLRDRYRQIYTLADHIQIWIEVRRSSHHYAHEHTVSIEADSDCPHNWINADTEDVRDAIVLELYDNAMLHWGDFNTDCAEIMREYMHRIYHDLEEEYDHLTSDEAVAEAIEANELYDPAELTE